MSDPEPKRNPVGSPGDIPGWFSWTDRRLFAHFLSPDAVVPRGDLVEIGVYLGKSAVLIGKHKRPDETFTVCDLFGADPGEASNREENTRSYTNISRQRFERNYLALHDELPVIVEAPSSTVLDHVKPGSARFVHVDGSHLYEHVATDLDSARIMLLDQGVVVFDDYRSPHTPGVAAAIWEGVFNKGLRPICLTTRKLYATFGDPRPHQERLEAWLTIFRRLPWETQYIAGTPVLRIIDDHVRAAGPAGNRPDLEQVVDSTDRSVQQIAADVRALTDTVRSVERKLSKMRRILGRFEDSRPSLLRWARQRAAALRGRP